MVLRLLVVLALLIPAPVMAQQVKVADALLRSVEDVIRPGFAKLASDAASFEETLEGACFADTPEAIADVRQAFGMLVESYGRIEFVRFGPMGEANRAERLYFWPDRKGIGLRQIQALLAEPVTGTIDVTGKSIAVQGLGALEYVLFGEGSDVLGTAAGHERCSYGHAISLAIAQTAAELADAWNDEVGISARLSRPDAANTDFRNTRESLETIVGAMAHGVEAIRDVRLLPFVGRDGEAQKPKSAPLWRSGLTARLVAANFAGLAALYNKSGLPQTMAADMLWVDNGIQFEFGNVARGTAVLTGPVGEALADPKQLRAYNYLVLITQSLETLLGENLPTALGLSVGFSSLDGD